MGEGTFSKVKFAVDIVSGEKVAIKILKKNVNEAEVTVLFNEIHSLQTIPTHPNIIKLIGYDQSVYFKKDSQVLVNYIIFEYASGGELFNLIKETGRFEEALCRYYFR